MDVDVVLFASDQLLQKTIRYEGITDASGIFRFADVEPGRYQVMLEKSGFVMFPKDPVSVERRGAPVAVEYQMPFGTAPRAKLSGQVLDSTGNPASHALVVLIRGPELRFTAETDSKGQFTFDQVSEGAYTLMASPEMKNGSHEVPTYFPASVEEEGARRLIISGNARVENFRLQAAPVARVRGAVTDASGRPAAHASLKLISLHEQPAHVVLSFDSYFYAVGEGPGFGPEVAHTLAADDGTFEFPAVPQGQWRIVAQTDPPGAPSGSTGVSVANDDVEGVRIVVQDPISLTGSAQWTIRCVSARLGCGQRSAAGAVVPVWFWFTDGQRNTLRAAVVQADGTFQLDGIPSGSAVLQEFPPIVNGTLLTGVGTGLQRRGTEIELARRDLLKISLAGSFAEGGSVILSETTPVDRSNDGLRLENALTASVHGKVENGGAAAVLLISEDYSKGGRSALAFCRADGTFDALGLQNGTYRIAAIQSADMEALRDPDLFALALRSETKVRVEVGHTASVELGPASRWPEQ